MFMFDLPLTTCLSHHLGMGQDFEKCLFVGDNRFGVFVAFRKRHAESFKHLGVDDRRCVGNGLDGHIGELCAFKSINSHVAGDFAESNVIDRNGSKAAVLDLLDFRAVYRDAGGVGSVEKHV